jgi:membrane protein required for colicin V production
MVIDLWVVLLLVLAAIKGFRKGLVVGLFSLLAIVVGAAAALKLSSKAATYLGQTFPAMAQSAWVPLVAFLLVFLLAVVLVRLVAQLIEESLEWGLLGWVNKLGGIIFFTILYLMVASIGLFYADKLGFLSAATASQSASYPLLKPLAPAIMNGLGAVIPLFKDLFEQLEDVFEQIGKSLP